MKETSNYAEQKNVTVVIEPCNKMEVGFNNNVVEVIKTINMVGSDNLRTMVDTYHANIEEKSVSESIRQCKSYLKHIHLSETNRGDFGTGHLDFVDVFCTLSQIGFEGYCAIGVYFTSQDIIEKAKNAIEYAKASIKLSELRSI